MNLGLGLGVTAIRRAGGDLDLLEQTETLLAAMSSEPDNTRKLLINSTVSALITAGVWAKLDFLHVYAAHASQAALLNWINPGTFNATLSGTPTFTVDRGFTSSSSNYVNTNFNPSTAGGHSTLNSTCFGVGNLTEGSSTTVDAGANDATQRTMIRFLASAQQLGSANSAIAVSTLFAVAAAVGLATVNRSAASGAGALTLYKNGASLGNEADASLALPNATLKVGTSEASTFAARQFCCAFTGASLNSTEQDATWDAINAYMAAVGAWSL